MSEDRWIISKAERNKSPVPHIYTKTLVPREVYDRLYEQWGNIQHPNWQKFCNEMGVQIYFHNDFTRMLTPKQGNTYIGYWFFQQRTDKSKGGEVELTDGVNKKLLSYWDNTMFIIESNKHFTVHDRKHKLPERLFCEMYFNNSITEKFKKWLS